MPASILVASLADFKKKKWIFTRVKLAGKLPSMKVKFLLTFLFIAFLSVNVFSQKQNISLNFKDISLERLLLEIEKQSEYRFFFEQSGIDLTPKISIQTENASITNVLEKLFNNTAYS